MRAPNRPKAADPTPGPDLNTPDGLLQLRRLLLPLTVEYDEARISEALAWQHFQDVREVDAGPPLQRVPQYRSALAARDGTIRARRALADGVARLLVRGHALDCSCLICALEQKLLEGLILTPKEAPRRRAPAAKNSKASKGQKGGRRHV